jgi:glycosyltransferase involved in cell wall biosynthesis
MKLNNELVSIIVPVYNGEKFLSFCLDQLIEQDYKNLEIIVVDDGSTDNSLKIANLYSMKDDRVKVFHKTNGGTGSALNLGFSKCSGKYLTWASCDDVKYSNFISQLVKCLEDNEECEFAFSDFEEAKINNLNNKAKFSNRVNLNRSSGVMDDFLNITYKFCITGTCFLFTKDLKDNVGNFNEIPGEDYIMGAKMGLVTKVYYLNESLGIHVLHNDSLTIKQPNCTKKADEITRNMLSNYFGFM